MTCTEFDGYICIDNVTDLDLRQTLDCGQSFRWTENADGSFDGIAFGKKVRVRLDGERLYIETMEKVLSHTRKVLVNYSKNGNLMVLPLDQMLKGAAAPAAKSDSSDASDLLRLPPASSSSSASTSSTSSSTGGSIMDQRRANAQRNDYQRQGE